MDRSQYEQQWNFDPERRIPAGAPKPWLVAGYSFKAVDNVLRVDYLAQRIKSPRPVYDVPGGEITYIGHAEELRGMPHGQGTLFVLWPTQHPLSSTLARILDEARVRVANTRDLKCGRAENSENNS